MSSHREAPAIAKDPVADNTDLYAFVSPDNAGTVTLIANFIPWQMPAGGPSFYEFADDVLYEIQIDNNGDGVAEISYQFQFSDAVPHPNTFMYNTGPITALADTDWKRRQQYTVSKVVNGTTTVLGTAVPCPPCNIGAASTPNYAALAAAAVRSLPTGETVFAGQRAESYYADAGAFFDLLNLRPFENLNIVPRASAAGINTGNRFNVHSIAIQVPKSDLSRNGTTPMLVSDPAAVIGVYASAKRRKARTLNANGTADQTGPWVQVSRLGNPLINEIMMALKVKDLWNSQLPQNDSQFLTYVQHPELAKTMPTFYPGVLPNLAAYKKARTDSVALYLTGIPAKWNLGVQTVTGSGIADLLRLNMAVPPTSSPNPNGLLSGDLAGFPNGRRVDDDVFTIALRALLGVTLPLVDATFTPDSAANVLSSGVSAAVRRSATLPNFPYLGVPYDGYGNPDGT